MWEITTGQCPILHGELKGYVIGRVLIAGGGAGGCGRGGGVGKGPGIDM